MLTGKNAIITGSNRGIGNAVMHAFARNHANIWALDRVFDEAFYSDAESLQNEFGVTVRAIPVDLSERDSIRTAITAVNEDKLPIDILVNNAGINYRGTFLSTPLEDMEKLFQVNYYAPIQLIQSVAKRMIRNKGGNIINVGSVSGIEHNTGNFAYAVTKASLIWATQTISRELAPYNIRVNGIAPGVTDTQINAGNEKNLRETVFPRMNIQRSGSPDEIAQAILFLASDASSFISGQIIRVDGGRF